MKQLNMLFWISVYFKLYSLWSFKWWNKLLKRISRRMQLNLKENLIGAKLNLKKYLSSSWTK